MAEPAPFSADSLSLGAGTLYWAPLGSTEPQTLTDAWPAAWKAIGYTRAGHQFTMTRSSEALFEPYAGWPTLYALGHGEAFVAFDAAEETRTKWDLAMGANTATLVTGGSVVEPAAVGTDPTRVMLGWESNDGELRMVWRRCLNVASIEVKREKTPAYATLPLKMACELPLDNKLPFKMIFADTRGPGGGAPVPNVPPTVAISSPANGYSTVAGTAVTVTVAAVDTDGTVVGVNLYANGALVATGTSAPISFSWTPATAGTYSLTASATDNAGATATSSAVSVTATTPTSTPPTITFTTPSAGAAFLAGSNTSVVATITPAGGQTIATAVLSVNGVAVGSASSVVSGTYTWSSVPLPSAPGTVTLSITATDTAGTPNTATRNIVTANTATAVISSPGSQTVSPSTSLTFTGTANSPLGSLTSVALFRDGVQVATTSTLPATWSMTVSAPGSDGTYVYTARATDQLGQGPASGGISITVQTTSAVGEPTTSNTGPRVSLASAGPTLSPTWTGSETLIAVGDSWSSKIAAGSTGTVFRVQTGTHRVAGGLRPKNGQQFIGEAGAIVTGFTNVGTTGWTNTSGTIYSKSNGAWPASHDGGVGPGAFSAGWTESHWSEDLVVDGVPYQRVSGTTPAAGQWAYTGGAGGTIYINTGGNPSAKTSIECSFYQGAVDFMSTQSGQGERVVLKNLTITGYPSSNQNAAIMTLDGGGGIGGSTSYPMLNVANGYDYLGTVPEGTSTSSTLGGWLIDHCKIAYCHSVGIYAGPGTRVQDCLIDYCGQVGIKAAGRNAQYLRCVVDHSNWTHYDTFVEAGGFKGWNVCNLLIADCEIRNSIGSGAWIDYVWPGNVITYNYFHDNTSSAVAVEMSEGAEVSYNKIIGNCTSHRTTWATDPSYTANYITGQVWGYNSRNYWVHHNYIDASTNGWGGVALQEQERGGMAPFAQGTGGGTPAGPYAGKRATCSGTLVEYNSIRIPAGAGQCSAHRTIVTQDYSPYSNQSMGKLAGWIKRTDTDYGSSSNMQPYAITFDHNWYHVAATGDNAHAALQSAASSNYADFPFRWDGEWGSQVLVPPAPYTATNPYAVSDSGRRFGSFTQWARALSAPGNGTGGFGQDANSSVVVDQSGGGGGGSTATATITSPTAGSSQTGGSTFTVSGTATAGSGSLTRVDVYINGTLAASDTVSPFTSWSTTVTAPSTAGSYTLTARATDAAGQGADSSGVSFTVPSGGGGGGGGGTLVLNEGFEAGTLTTLQSWFDSTVVQSTTSPAAGTKCCQVTSTTNTGTALNSTSFNAITEAVDTSKTYTFSIKARADGTARQLTLYAYWNNGTSGVGPNAGGNGDIAVQANTGAGAYSTLTGSALTPPAGATGVELRLIISAGGAGEVFRLDDLTVTKA